ncbi:interleukin-27 subunit alpha isoform X1 [Pogona vitticeps]
MHLCGAAFLLQTLLSYYMLAAAVPARPRGDKASTVDWQANLQKEFRRSVNFSRQLLCKIRVLKHHYLSDRLPGASLTFVTHKGLFSLTSLDLHTWLSLSDAKRLTHLAKMLSFYHDLIQQLKDYEADREDSRFVPQLEDLGFNLRDLSHHVSYQISLWGLPSENNPEPTPEPPQILQSKDQWRNRQEGYIVLRHLESFLCRATRDFWILKDKIRM